MNAPKLLNTGADGAWHRRLPSLPTPLVLLSDPPACPAAAFRAGVAKLPGSLVLRYLLGLHSVGSPVGAGGVLDWDEV